MVFIQDPIDALVEEVVVVAGDETLADEDNHLAQISDLLFVPDRIGPVPGEAAGVVDEKDIKPTHPGILYSPVEAGPVQCGSAGDEVGVPGISQAEAMGSRKVLDGQLLQFGPKPVPLVQSGIPDPPFGPEAFHMLEVDFSFPPLEIWSTP